MDNKRKVVKIIMIAMAVCFIQACQKDTNRHDLPEDAQIIAVVNNTPLTDRHLQHELINLFLASGQNTYNNLTEEQSTNIQLQAIQNLINTQLLVDEAHRRGLDVNEVEVNRRIQSLQSRYSSRDVFFQEMAIRDLTLEDLRDEALRGLLVEKLMNLVFEPVKNMPETTVKTIFQENMDRFVYPEAVYLFEIMILVFQDDPEDVRESKRNQLQHIRNRVLNNEEFGQLAFKYSDCPSSRNHGEKGWMTSEMMFPELADIAFDLAPGSMSDVIESNEGYHLLKVKEHRPTLTPDYDTDYDTIRQAIIEDQKRTLMNALINKLYDDAIIEIPG